MKAYKNPKLVVDIIILRRGRIVLIKRKFAPFRGKWALPGGFVDYGEEPQKAAVREAKEETGLDVRLADERIAYVFGDPKRDPRGHLISLVFVAKPGTSRLKTLTGETTDAKFFSRKDLPKGLAADHRQILKDVLGW
jgi:8-oxo-dGTP diphosphatase